MSNKISVIPLSVDGTNAPAEAFSHFADSSWSMFLDSGDSQREDAKHSVLVATPVATITYDETHTDVHHCLKQSHERSRRDPFEALNELQSQYFQTPTNEECDLPFLIGAMGLFGYDLGRAIEKFECTATDPHHTPDMAVGLYSWSLIYQHKSNQWFYCFHADFAHPTLEEVTRWLTTSVSDNNTFSLRQPWEANQTQTDYEANIDRVHKHLRAGDCYQVNYAQRFNTTYEGDEWQAYLTLKQANNAPFSAFIRLPESCILSISPERFVQVDVNGKVETKPIKGTKPRGKTEAEDNQLKDALRTSEKDQAENLMIVDLLRNDISKHCQPGSVEVPALFDIHSFASVHHMISTVTGKLDEDTDALTLLRDAFPGGSITGAPKIRAMEVIESLEPHRRNVYCGSVGYLGINGDMDTSICIRTLLCEPPHIYCWAGGGIVLDSEPSSEYQESLDKVAKILPALPVSSNESVGK